MNHHIPILIVLSVLNLVTFILYGIDKRRARKGRWRISEATLLWMAALGGSLGAWCGMRVWHHKTLHRKFRYGVPALLFLQILLTIYIHTRM